MHPFLCVRTSQLHMLYSRGPSARAALPTHRACSVTALCPYRMQPAMAGHAWLLLPYLARPLVAAHRPCHAGYYAYYYHLLKHRHNMIEVSLSSWYNVGT